MAAATLLLDRAAAAAVWEVTAVLHGETAFSTKPDSPWVTWVREEVAAVAAREGMAE
jgi:hypothetical protein